MLTSVRLYVQGESLRPVEITKLLGVEPARAHARGDTRKLANGEVVAEKIGVWVWKTGADGEGEKISDCISSLLKAFDRSIKLVTCLPNAEATWIDIHLVQDRKPEGKTDDVEFALTSQDIRALNDFGLPVEVTIGFA